jgi:hypothetical protein
VVCQEMHLLELLRVCKESREVHLKVFKNCLQGCRGKELIRFSDDTTIYISNFSDLAMEIRKEAFASFEGEEFRKPQFFNMIRELGFDIRSKRLTPCNWLISLFEHLKMVRVYAGDYQSETSVRLRRNDL